MSDVANQIERLRRCRVHPARDVSITKQIQALAASAKRTHTRLGRLIDLWEQCVPEQVATRSAITGLRGGVLHVAVEDASTAFELDRLLREGLEQHLRAQYRGTLVRVRVKVQPPATHEPERKY